MSVAQLPDVLRLDPAVEDLTIQAVMAATKGAEAKCSAPFDKIAMLLPFHQACEVSCRAQTGSVLRNRAAFICPLRCAPVPNSERRFPRAAPLNVFPETSVSNFGS